MDNLIKVARINGQSVTFNEGETILEVARRMGIFIPTLCEFTALNHRPGTCYPNALRIYGIKPPSWDVPYVSH